jgi:hypothetical protein
MLFDFQAFIEELREKAEKKQIVSIKNVTLP